MEFLTHREDIIAQETSHKGRGRYHGFLGAADEGVVGVRRGSRSERLSVIAWAKEYKE